MPRAAVDLDSIRQAQQRIGRYIRRTPLLPSTVLNRTTGAEVFLKAEALQRTGSFKVRGATNRLAVLSPQERQRGVIAASAGNHGQGVALAASIIGTACTIVMPEGAALPKVEATRGYGATVTLHGDNYDEAYQYALRLSRELDLLLIPAFDDPLVVAGQGTIGLEVAEDLPDVALVVVPVGGGGLAAGVAVAVKTLLPKARVIGVQAQAAPGTTISWQKGTIIRHKPAPTIADGIAVAGPGEITLPLLHHYLDDMVCVDEESIARAMVLLLERSKVVVEGAGAVGVAALLSQAIVTPQGKVVVVLSGANVDINLLDRIIEHGLTHAGRYLTLIVGLDDRPGQLAALLSIIADSGANVLNVQHRRWGIGLPVGRVEVELQLEVRSAQHTQEVRAALAAADFVEAEGQMDVGSPLVFAPRRWSE